MRIGAYPDTIDKIFNVLWSTVRLILSLPSELDQKSAIGPYIAPIHVGDERHTIN